MNEAYDAVQITVRAVSVSMAAKKLAGVLLNTPETLKGTAKLVAAVATLTMAVKWAQEKKCLPVDPFESA